MSVKKIKQIEFADGARVFKLLGDQNRLRMLKMLEQSECCVCEFVEIFQVSQPAISQHLRKLRDVGIVKEKRKGQWMFYSLNKETDLYPVIEDILSYIPDQTAVLDELAQNGLRIRCD
ncbi:ArsR/SmtB family transcription factor [Bacillus sp. FJAT-44742]|uniref:ArsR/SmtB family transcription factor n=1 Tax=Bacillus sp. FJAT-44742 TaxID=2014005 RepID=UPI000C23B61F|nr:metalloregulator ArsR/SmtB family transcription factor [Bacillus sp. FJAT-44742]